MAELKQAKVPDIGNYTNIPVIEVLVKVGDTVGKDQGLVTLESDKATMEVPAPFAGVVKEVKVKLGDEVSEGSVVAVIEAGDAWLTAWFCLRRLNDTTRRPAHVLEMVWTSVLIPPLSLYWRLRGALRFRVAFL